jgi:hypothetical protein
LNYSQLREEGRSGFQHYDKYHWTSSNPMQQTWSVDNNSNSFENQAVYKHMQDYTKDASLYRSLMEF